MNVSGEGERFKGTSSASSRSMLDATGESWMSSDVALSSTLGVQSSDSEAWVDEPMLDRQCPEDSSMRGQENMSIGRPLHRSDSERLRSEAADHAENSKTINVRMTCRSRKR